MKTLIQDIKFIFFIIIFIAFFILIIVLVKIVKLKISICTKCFKCLKYFSCFICRKSNKDKNTENLNEIELQQPLEQYEIRNIRSNYRENKAVKYSVDKEEINIMNSTRVDTDTTAYEENKTQVTENNPIRETLESLL